MVTKLSIDEQGPQGEVQGDPRYGLQLNYQAIAGVPAEGRVAVSYYGQVQRFSDGSAIRLHIPHYSFIGLNFGAIQARTRRSPRIAPPVFGVGLLEAIDDKTLLSLQARKLKTKGHVNIVFDRSTHRKTIGRFGWKAGQPNLVQQTADALIEDMGITSALYPEKNCPIFQLQCRQAASERQPDASPQVLSALTEYVRLLGAPRRRDEKLPVVKRGERLFHEAGCENCHVPNLTTGADAEHPELSNREIHPYSDLLLHDMGASLSDGRREFQATASEWRTAPLWGLGLSEKVAGHLSLMHDGRAKTILEAIMWHGGDAAPARKAVAKYERRDREALLEFLQSL